MNVFDLFASISLDDSEYTSKLSAAKDGLASFGKTAAAGVATVTKATLAAGAAITGTVTAGAAQTAAAADNIDKASQKMGISAEAYQEWDFILQHSGSSIDSMSKGMMTLQNKAVSNAEAFEALGIAQEDVANMSTEELFAATIEGLQGMEEGAERTALAQELLGGAAKELGPLLNTTAADTEAMKQQVHELGGVMSDDAVKAGAAFQDSLQNMKTVFGGMKTTMLSSFLPSMSKTMDGITAIFAGDKGGVKMVTDGINEFIKNIKDVVPKFMEAGKDILEAFLGAITDNLPEIAVVALDVITSLFNGIVDNLPEIIDAAMQVVNTVIQTISEMLPEIVTAGVQLITTLANSLAEQAPTLIPVILDGLMAMVKALIDNAPELLKAALTLIKALAKGLIDYLPQLIERLPEIIEGIVNFLTSQPAELISAALEIILQLASGLIEAIPDLVMKLPEIITSIVNGLLEGLGRIADVGKNLVEGLWNGIDDKVEWIKDKIKGFGKKVLDGIKSFFGISSPSKVMAQMGEYLGEGLGLGWEDAMKDVEKEMTDDLDIEGNIAVNKDINGTGAFGFGMAAAAGMGDIIIPVYIGGDQLDEVIVTQEQLRNFRSGGR